MKASDMQFATGGRLPTIREYIADLEARLKAAEPDARRYRWLRAHQTDRFVRNNESEPCLLLPHNVDCLNPQETDEAVDAAMEANP